MTAEERCARARLKKFDTRDELDALIESLEKLKSQYEWSIDASDKAAVNAGYESGQSEEKTFSEVSKNINKIHSEYVKKVKEALRKTLKNL